MREVLDVLERWWRAGDPVGMATVVATWKSAPRPAGAVMLVGPDGSAVGSVSGGCVEGAVYELAKEVVDAGTPVLQRYGVSEDDASPSGSPAAGSSTSSWSGSTVRAFRSWTRSPGRSGPVRRSPW